MVAISYSITKSFKILLMYAAVTHWTSPAINNFTDHAFGIKPFGFYLISTTAVVEKIRTSTTDHAEKETTVPFAARISMLQH